MVTPSAPAAGATPVRIRRAEAFGLNLPLAKPVLMAGTRLEHSGNLLVRLESEDGLVGWGEANAAPSHGGATLPEMLQACEAILIPGLVGQDARRLGGLSASLATRLETGHSAAAAVDMALHDLVGHHLGVPAHVLLGGLRRDTVEPLWLLGTGSPEGDLAEGERRLAEGYRFFKLKVGVRPVDEEVALAVALRRRLGPSIRLCADANMGMTAEQAIRYAEGVREADLDFFEQPLLREDLDGLQRLVQRDLVPIGLDESITNVGDLLRHAALGAQGASLKTLKLGGMSGVAAAAQVCAAHGQHINLAGKIAETGIASAALLHLAGIAPNVDWGVSPSHLYLAEDIVRTPLAPERGAYAIPVAPGLGIEVDEARVGRFRIF